MTSLQQCKNIRLFTDDKIKIAEGSCVYSLMKDCAKRIHILPESFRLFRIVQKNSILLPYRKKLPNYPLYYRVVDFSFNIEWFCTTDPELLLYLYHQIMFDLLSDTTVISGNNDICEIIATDIVRFSKQSSRCCDLAEAYLIYFEVFESAVHFRKTLSYDHFYSIGKHLVDLSETACLIQIVKIFSGKVYFKLDLIKHTFNVKIPVPTKASGKSKPSEKKFSIKVTTDYVSVTVSDEKQSETKLNYNKMHSINVTSDKSVSIVYDRASQAPISVSFKNLKDIESFLALVDYYFSLLSPSKLLITKFGDIKTDDSSVQYIPSNMYNVIARNPYVSYFFDFEEATNGLQKILNRNGSYMITSNENYFCLSYSITDKIVSKAIIFKDGLYQIAGNEDYRFKYKDINDLVGALKPKIEGKQRVNLINRVSDSLLIDILTIDNFQFIIPPMFVDISRPQIHGSWIYTVFNCSFEDLSGNKKQCKYIEFSEYVKQKDILELCYSIEKISSESIVNFIGLCKPGRGNRISALVDYPSNMIYLQKFLDDQMYRPTPMYSYLNIIQQIALALKGLHNMKIEHGCPAPNHILLNPATLKIKLIDIGITKMLFLKNHEENPYCKKPLQENSFCELRWLPGTFLIHPSTSFNIALDMWAFGCTLWQIFNYGDVPLSEHSDDELINRYIEIKLHQSSTKKNNIKTPRWFSIKLDVPDQSSLKLNKMIQKLINYILTNYTGDQENAFDDIADLFNAYIFPVDRDIDVEEKLDSTTDINISRGPDGNLIFEKHNIQTKCTSFQNKFNSTFNEEHGNQEGYYYSDDCDCENSALVHENSGQIVHDNYERDSPDGYDKDVNIKTYNLCDSNSCEPTLDHSPILLAQLLEFNNKRWESSYYTLNEKIGAGNYGVVRKATVQQSESIPPDLYGREVAVKIFQILKGVDQAETVMESICKEALNMSKLEHHQIVPFYGISTTEDLKEVHIIMPFYSFGCLKKYIANYRTELKRERMASFGLQIAEGMEYISSQGFVHRDLALRNILVEGHTKVRIADLGLTRGVNKEADYYYILNKSSKSGLPVLSYPPEFFTNDFKYDKYGDVWSYGVTCFELWSYGERPYAAQNITNSVELEEFLKHSTLDIPSATPDVFEHVMKKCWLPKRQRWNFKEILTYIKTNITCNIDSRRPIQTVAVE